MNKSMRVRLSPKDLVDALRLAYPNLKIPDDGVEFLEVHDYDAENNPIDHDDIYMLEWSCE